MNTQQAIPISLPDQLKREVKISGQKPDGSILTPQYAFPDIYNISDGKKDIEFILLNRLKIQDVTQYTTQENVHFPFSDGNGELTFDMEIDAIALQARRAGRFVAMLSEIGPDIGNRTFDIRYAGGWTADHKRYGGTDEEMEEYTETLVANYQSAQKSEIKRLYDILAKAKSHQAILRVWPG